MAGLTLDGAYVEHDGRSVKIDADAVFTIGLNRAVAIIFETAKAADQGRPLRSSTPIKVLSEHPELGGKIEVSGLLGQHKPADTSTGSNGRTHPDDQKRPANLARIRPPGTSGLPKAWQSTPSQELTLPVADGADLPEVFIEALNALIAEIRRNSAHQKRYELEKGEKLEAAREDILYAFPFTEEAELFEDAKIELQVDGRRIEGMIVSISAGRLILALREELGVEITKAILVIDTTALLVALVAKIEKVKTGAISLNRDLADCVAGRNNNPITPAYITPRPARELDPAQQKAFAQATRAAVTWIWGPPGCGKTKTLGEIVRFAFENAKRVLVCSNTNKAVDQVLYSICQALTLQLYFVTHSKPCA